VRLPDRDGPIRVSAVAGLVAHGWVDPETADREFQSAIAHHEPDTRIAVANAAKLRYAEIYRRSLPALARDSSPQVAREAVRAMRKSGDAWFTSALVELLDDRRIRDLVRQALLDLGDDALALLSKTLEDPRSPAAVLRHIPRTISRFSSPAAVETLLHCLKNVRSGMVRYKILRGLQPLLAGPLGARADKTIIVEELRSTVDRALFLLHREVELVRGQEANAARATPGGQILVDVVRDKRSLATSRVFLLLALLYPEEDFRTIQSGVQSRLATSRASGIELLENLLPPDQRRPTIGLVSQGTPTERLQSADPDRFEVRTGYSAAVRSLARDASMAVSAFAMYHAAEIELEDSDVLPDTKGGDRAGASLRDRAIGVIERLPEALLRTRTSGSTAIA
jgi:hypothetical protein